jgi:hypothetical protein
MNISVKAILGIVSVLVGMQAHAYTFKFHNNLWDNLQVKMRLLGIMEEEETIDVPANGTGERSFGGLRFGLAPEYIKLVKTKSGADRIDPRRLCMTRIEFDSIVKQHANLWPDNVMSQVLPRPCPGLGDMEFEIVQSADTGELILVRIYNDVGLIPGFVTSGLKR